MAGGGGGSNTTHALLSPDPETLPIREVFRRATDEFLGTKGLQGQPTVAPYAPLTAGPKALLCVFVPILTFLARHDVKWRPCIST